MFIRLNKKSLLFLLIATGIFLALGSYFPDEIQIITKRITGATNVSSEGNDSRLDSWIQGIGMMSFSNIFIGNYFGLVTNSAPPEITKGIVESSLLQQILNIGFVATIIYYYTLFETRKLIAGRYKIILYACLIQTLIYQSIEVIPFLFLLFTLPFYTKTPKVQ